MKTLYKIEYYDYTGKDLRQYISATSPEEAGSKLQDMYLVDGIWSIKPCEKVSTPKIRKPKTIASEDTAEETESAEEIAEETESAEETAMKIRLIEPRNKRLKNKIATYNKTSDTWTIGKSKKEYKASFRYSLYMMTREEQAKSDVYQRHFNSIGLINNPYRPIKELDDMRAAGEYVQHEVRFFRVGVSRRHSNGIAIDGFEVLRY